MDWLHRRVTQLPFNCWSSAEMLKSGCRWESFVASSAVMVLWSLVPVAGLLSVLSLGASSMWPSCWDGADGVGVASW